MNLRRATRPALLAIAIAAQAAASPVPVNIRGRGWIEAEVLRVQDGRLWLALPGRAGEFAVAVGDVLWAAFPSPADLAALERSAASGSEDARRRLIAIFEDTRTFMPVPGSHAPRLGLAVVTHCCPRGSPESEPLLETLARDAWDPGIRGAGALLFARFRLARNRPSDAAEISRALLASGPAPRHEAEAWVILGEALLALGNPESALEACLHPVALYARDEGVLRGALECAERAARDLGDPESALVYADELRQLPGAEAAGGDPAQDDAPPTAAKGDAAP